MTSVDKKLARVERLLADPRFVRQGAIVATWRTSAGQRHGPYYALRYRDGTRQRSLYLGRSAALAAAVRRLLARRQRRRRELLALERVRAAVKAALRQHKRVWDRELAHAGLKRKGYQIQGWRSFSTAEEAVVPTAAAPLAK